MDSTTLQTAAYTAIQVPHDLHWESLMCAFEKIKVILTPRRTGEMSDLSSHMLARVSRELNRAKGSHRYLFLFFAVDLSAPVWKEDTAKYFHFITFRFLGLE